MKASTRRLEDTWNPPRDLSKTATGDIGVTGRGVVYATWSGSQHVRVSRKAPGSPWSPASRIGETPGTTHNAINGPGDALLAWEQFDFCTSSVWAALATCKATLAAHPGNDSPLPPHLVYTD